MHGKKGGMRPHESRDVDMPARISSYINADRPDAIPIEFFKKDYVGSEFPEMTLEFALTENYESLLRYTQADNSVLVLTTQYQNHSSFDPNHPAKNAEELSHNINDIIRNISRKHAIPLTDLDREMAPYDYLQIDGTHFNEEGIRIKGELVGAVIFDALVEKYGLEEHEGQQERG